MTSITTLLKKQLAGAFMFAASLIATVQESFERNPHHCGITFVRQKKKSEGSLLTNNQGEV